MSLELNKIYKTTAKGYIRHTKDNNGKLRMEHCLVWEKHNGKIPNGMQIHHIDGNKTNNDISNLMLVTPIEHKKYHQGCILINGEWYKPCKICGKYKKCDNENWYFSRGWINGRICKRCYCKKQVEDRRIRVANGWKRKQANKSLR